MAALLQTTDDTFTVLEGVRGVVLELRIHLQNLKSDAADPGQHGPVRRGIDGHGAVAAFGLKVGQLGDQDIGLALRIVDDRGTADELDGAVVAGQVSVLIGAARQYVGI